MSDHNNPPSGKLRAPKLTLSYLESLIESEDYHHFPNTGVTVCCLILKNDYTITEDVVCANRKLFDPVKGKAQAKRKAIQRLMEHEYYLLRHLLTEQQHGPKDSEDERDDNS